MLLTSDEIEKALDGIPVELDMPNTAGSGVLKLLGEHTNAVIRTKHYENRFDFSGEFTDIQLKDGNGRRHLLHNAFTRSSHQLADGGGWEYNIFPNVVALDSSDIFPSCRVSQISFTLKGLEEIFNYEIVEWQSLYGADKETVADLKKLRKSETIYPRHHEFFHAEDVVLLHRLPRVLSQKVDKKKYEIYVREQRKRNKNGISITPIVIAAIKFTGSVTVSEALDSAWSWRSFFQQITMKEMPFERLNCKSSKTGGKWSALYLSNMANRAEVQRDFFLDFNPGNVPYGQWRHRKRFSESMGRWLASDPQRRSFRVRIERAISRASKEYSPNILLELCAGVEGLDELKAYDTSIASKLELITQAAVAVTKKEAISIDEARIRGVLSLLQHASLPQRLKTLASQANVDIFVKDLRRINGKIIELRNIEAHGGFWDEVSIPSLAHVIELLSSMCVIWDLSTSGLPAQYDDRQLIALKRFSFFVQEFVSRNGA